MNCSIELYKENQLFKLYIVRFKDLKYMFWLPKTSLNSREANVYLDNNIPSFQEGTIGLSLNGITNIQDLKKALDIFIQIMANYQVNDISFKFIPHNDKQQEIVTILKPMLGISNKIRENETLSNTDVSTNNPQQSDKSYLVINGRIFDSNTFIGVIGQDGYTINYEDNAIYQNGQFIAWIGDNNKNQGSSKTTARNLAPSYLKNTRPSNVSTEPSGPIKLSKGKSAAFVDLPIIMFILSALLLIGSVILLFILQ